MNQIMDPQSVLVAECRATLAETLAENSDMILAMMATVDGFVVTSETAQGWNVNADRVSAMASSGHALGETVANEFAEGKCNDVIVNTDWLSIVFLAIPARLQTPLILGVAATRGATLGTVLYDAKKCGQGLATVISDQD